jgi:hypothetical protein
MPDALEARLFSDESVVEEETGAVADLDGVNRAHRERRKE